ncbi:acetolactate decarboxylase [Tenacibaculum caenipelagi]|uniref:Alpha-acetolactate decarboxylase n=1 Tax=Tenacibaculum caenipelagi TaxID=1325435 RepID=A0A4R6TDN6_9FLAO|nr:acetolactate decarboxylase [Tenacibaculum caenipelagi]TDQ23877.1 alpha-acetolactate decarboxylase [Tenacibaculum caenipelagi]
MKVKHIITLTFLLLWKVSFSQQITNGFSMPESIISNGKRFFVSNQGQDFIKKDADGFISEISAEGTILTKKFLPLKGVLNAPKGMTIVNNVLFVADLERIVGFNINNRKTVFELTIPEAKLLNDICQLENGFIAVTETLSGNIYKIDITKKTYAIIGNIPTVNGITYNQKTKELLVCSNGKNYGDGNVYLKSENSEFKKLPNISNGFFDGIEWIDNDHLLISDWITFPTNGSGKLWIYDLKNQQAEFKFTGESIADIYYDQKSSSIYMPQMFHNRVLISDWKQLNKKQQGVNNLYNYGIIDGFVGGLYRGTLPIKNLKLKGDFGIGAPDMLNGEMTLINGKAYQTKSTGETTELDNSHLTSFASVTFFKSDTSFIQTSLTDKNNLLSTIKNVLPSSNKMYAIKISGTFDYMKTRAFSPVEKEPFPKLTNMLNQQHFFEYKNTEGTLVGFLLPNYLDGINVSGFHFHFLSKNTKQGGHTLDFKGNNLKIEIAVLKTFEMDTPNNSDFQNFEFQKSEKAELKIVEHGK